jgi:hypothetical protein
MPKHIQNHDQEMNIPVRSRLLFVNVGEPSASAKVSHEKKICFHTNRAWEDSLQFGFIAGGQYDPKYISKPDGYLYNRWIKQINSVKKGDIVCAYVTELGFVGIGECTSEAVTISERQLIDGTLLFDHRAEIQNENMLLTIQQVTHMGYRGNTFGCENDYAFLVKWYRTLTRNQVLQTQQIGLGQLGITQHVVSDMKTDKRKIMVNFVEEIFNVEFKF